MKNLFLNVLIVLGLNGSAQCWRSVSGGGALVTGIKSDGSLWHWGAVPYSQTPQQIGSDLNWKTVSNSIHYLSVKTDGSLWAWFTNFSGELGDGTHGNSGPMTPEKIGNSNDWEDASAGGNHSLALKTNGTLWASGENALGACGLGTISATDQFTQVGSDSDWKTSSAGSAHSLVLKTNGTLWAFGYNIYGQLGDGSNTDRHTPVQIGSAANWKYMAAGWDHSFGIKTDGTLWAWGKNSSGQLGDGTSVDKSSPVQIGSDTHWESVTGGARHSLGLKSDGTVWAWGSDSLGQLGNGNYVSSLVPLQITNFGGGTLINAGWYSSYVIEVDGTIWSWGDNTYGELGDGTNVKKNAPVNVATANCYVGIKNIIRDEDVYAVYPNPGNGEFSVSSGNSLAKTFYLSDVTGRLLLTVPATGANTNFNISHLPAGIYYLKIQSEERSKVLKVVKQ